MCFKHVTSKFQSFNFKHQSSGNSSKHKAIKLNLKHMALTKLSIPQAFLGIHRSGPAGKENTFYWLIQLQSAHLCWLLIDSSEVGDTLDSNTLSLVLCHPKAFLKANMMDESSSDSEPELEGFRPASGLAARPSPIPVRSPNLTDFSRFPFLCCFFMLACLFFIFVVCCGLCSDGAQEFNLQNLMSSPSTLPALPATLPGNKKQRMREAV